MADKNDHITNPSFKISTSSVVESDRVYLIEKV